MYMYKNEIKKFFYLKIFKKFQKKLSQKNNKSKSKKKHSRAQQNKQTRKWKIRLILQIYIQSLSVLAVLELKHYDNYSNELLLRQ